MRTQIHAAAVALLIGICVLLTGCGFGEDWYAKSSDGKWQVKVPSHWSEQTELHDDATLQVANTWREQYFILLSDDKASLTGLDVKDVQGHSNITRGSLLSSVSGSKVSEPKELTINGNPAVQYEISGTVNDLKVVYLHTTIETENDFHQLLGWTLASKKSTAMPILKQVAASFEPAKDNNPE